MKNNIEHNRIFKNEKIASRIIERQAFIVTPLDSTLHLLNEVGTRIWQLIEEKKNIEKIIEHICAEYDMDRLTIERDVREFIQILEKKGIVEIKKSA
jgi:hypothetical protein